MKEVRRIAKNSAALLAGTILNRVLLLVFFSLLARRFGEEGLGDFYFLITLGSLFSIFANFGLDVLTVRQIARDHEELKWFFPNVAIMKVALSIVSVLLTYVYLTIAGYSSEMIEIGLISSLITLFSTNINHTDSIFRGFESFEFSALFQVLSGVLILAGGYVILRMKGGLHEIITFMVIAYCVTAMMGNIAVVWKWKGDPFQFDFSRWKTVIADAYPFMLTSGISVVYYRIDILMLSYFSGHSAVGLYGAAAKIIENYGVIPSIFVSSIFPVMARQYSQPGSSLKATVNLALKYLLFAGIPLTVLSIVDAGKIIHFFYGDKFANSIAPFQILCVRAISVFVTTLLGYLLFSANKQKSYMQIFVVVLLVNVLLNALLIPHFSYIGPPLAILGSTLCSIIFHLYFAQKFVCEVHFLKYSVKPIIASIPIAVFVYVSPFNVFTDIMTAAVIYGVATYSLSVFDDHDAKLFKTIVRAQTI